MNYYIDINKKLYFKKTTMDFLNSSKISMDFLSKYPPEQYQKVIPKIFELGILFLKYNYSKLNFSIEELDNIIYNLYLSTTINFPTSSPFPSFSQPTKLKNYKLKKLKKPTNIILRTKPNTNLNKYIYYNSKKIIEPNKSVKYSKSFFDSDYHVPSNRSLRNKQLYNRNIKSPNFDTQNKKIYPYWWWNLNTKNDDYDSESSEEDHHPRNPERIYPKELEQNIKKIYQKQYISNNRYNNIRLKYHLLNDVSKNNYNYFSLNNLDKKRFCGYNNDDSHDENKTSYKISYDKDFNIENLQEHYQNLNSLKFGNLNAKKKNYKIKKINHLVNYQVTNQIQNQ